MSDETKMTILDSPPRFMAIAGGEVIFDGPSEASFIEYARDAADRIRALEADAANAADRIAALERLGDGLAGSLATASDYMSDAAAGALQFRGKASIVEMATADLVDVSTALAAWDARNVR